MFFCAKKRGIMDFQRTIGCLNYRIRVRIHCRSSKISISVMKHINLGE